MATPPNSGPHDSDALVESDGVFVQATGIDKVYRKGENEIYALRGVDLSVRQGEFIAIMGPSGSGKSTLMHILGCLDQPTTGQYVLDGERIDSLDDTALSQVRNREVSFVFQSFNLLSDCSVVENIGLPLVYAGVDGRERRERCVEAAQAVGLGERLSHKPTELSGGQVQRVAIARALVNQSKIIMADEPTGNLDTVTGQEIFALFGRLHREGKTIILVTHDEQLASFADRIIRLRDGRIVGEERIDPSKRWSAGEGAQEGVSGVATASADGDYERITGRLRKDPPPCKDLRWRDILRIGIREGLLAHKTRTALTMLGVIFGVSAVIAMSSIGEGAKQEAIEQIRQLGVNNVRIRAVELEGEELKEARRRLSDGLTVADADALSEIVPQIERLAPIKNIEVDIRLRYKKSRGRILATVPEYEDVSNFFVAKGRFINGLDMAHSRPVCVMGASIKKELFANDEAIDQRIRLGMGWYHVVGIMEAKSIPKGRIRAISNVDLNHDIYIPLSAALKRVKQDKNRSEIDEISIRVAEGARVRHVAEVIQRVIDRRHRDVRDYEMVVPEELLRREQATQRIFNIVMGCIAGISLLVGGIGIMNIMLATVTERTKEIGTRRAVGACQGDILKQFLVEAVGISVAGGLAGIVLGWGIGEIIAVSAKWKTIVSVQAILLGFGVSAGVGVIFGLFPAWKAAAQDPIEALRHE